MKDINVCVIAPVNSTSVTFPNISATTIVEANVSVMDQTILTYMLQLVCIVVLVFGVVGNGLVLFIFGRKFSCLKTFEVYMVSLAAADFIGTITFPSIQLHTVHGGDFQDIGNTGCKIIYFALTASITISASTLVAVSFDRFIIVRWPFRERLPTFTLVYLIGVPWVLGFCHALIHLTGNRITLCKDGPIAVCRQNFTLYEMRVFLLMTFLLQNALPLVLMIVIYSFIIHRLHRSALIFNFSGREMYARHKRNRRAIKLLVVIITIFFLCTTPNNVFNLWVIMNVEKVDMGSMVPLYTLTSMILMVNSCLNPLVYAKLHRRFRYDMLDMFACFKHARYIHEYLTVAKSSSGWFAERKCKRKSYTSSSSEVEESNVSSIPNWSVRFDIKALQNVSTLKETIL